MASTKAGTVLFITLAAVASALPKNGTIFDCTSEGRFSDPFDCTSFFTCVAETDGSLVRTKGDCKGYAFHPDLHTCVHPSKVPGCNSRKPKQLIRDETLAGVCSESKFMCTDCKTVVNCIETEGYTDVTCGKGYSCSTKGNDELAGTAACLPINRAEDGCLCAPADANQPKPDPNTKKGFIFCPPEGNEPSVYNCEQGLAYNAVKNQCLSLDGSPSCSHPGTFTLDDCSGTYNCLSTATGFVKSVMNCEADKLVAPNKTMCSDPCAWPKQKHECTREGRFRDPTDCSKFVVCVGTAADSNLFNEAIKSCPDNHIWDENANGGKGHCGRADEATCEAAPKHNCPVDKFTCNSGAFRSELREEVDDTENTIQNVIQLLQEEQR